VVIVDETSMVSLSLMAKLLEAVRSDARLVLVGDPGQLASVEAGAVLGDIVGPAAEGIMMRPAARALLAAAAGQAVPDRLVTVPLAAGGAGGPGDTPAAIGDGIVVLSRVHRFGGQIAALAEAVGRGDADSAMAVLRAGHPDVRWIPVDIGQPGASHALAPVRRAIVDAGRMVFAAACAGEEQAALDALGSFRVLCAHRRGEYGASTWMARVEEWLAADLDGFATEGIWYVGRPVLITENDYGLKLYNGDTGVVVAGRAGHPVAVFQRGAELLEFSPTRLAAVDTVYAMTVHKSQGSQFDGVAVLLPDPASPILTRELLYTAITRARRRLLLVGTEAAVRAALNHPIGRASGLRRWLWESE
jgi:exodeoxyribonuclease V alpha subunit